MLGNYTHEGEAVIRGQGEGPSSQEGEPAASLKVSCTSGTHTGRGAGTKLQAEVKKLTQDLEVKRALYKLNKKRKQKTENKHEILTIRVKTILEQK